MFFKIVNPTTLAIEQSYEADEAVKYGGPWGQYPHIAVPFGMEQSCVKCEQNGVETVTVVDVPEHTIPAVLDGEGNVVTPEQTVPAVTHEEERPVYALVEDATLLAAKAAADKQLLVAAAYDRMNNDIYGEMALVFGTTKSDSASAFFETWKLMVAAPTSFANEGLHADKEVGTFHAGDELNTTQKITDYANARIADANGYSVYRMKRIEQFRAERVTILNG